MSQLGILYRYEMKKILKKKMTWISFCGVILVMLVCCFEVLLNNYVLTDAQTGESVYYSAYEIVMDRQARGEKFNGRLIDDILLREMQAAYAGVQTQEQERVTDNAAVNVSAVTTIEVPDDAAEAERLSQQRRQYEAIYNYVRGVVGDEEVHTVDAAGFYGVRQQMIREYEQVLCLTEGEKEYWRRHEAQTPYAYYWDRGVSMMLASFKTMLALTALMTGMIFSGVFADEHMRKTDQLVLCSRHGRGMLYLAKLLAAMTLAVVGAILVEGITMLSLGAVYGYGESWNAPLQIYLESSPFALTMGQGIVILLVLLVLAAVLHSVLALVLSCWTRSGVASMSLVMVYTLGTLFVNVPERMRLLSQCLYLSPAKAVRASAFCNARLVGGAGHYLTFWQTGMLLYPLLALGLALLGGLIYRRWQISGR